MMKKIMVACGQGTCTSKSIAMKLEKYFRETSRKDVSINICKFVEIPAKAELGAIDVLVTSSPVKNVQGLRSIIGTPLLTGINAGKVFQEVENALNEIVE